RSRRLSSGRSAAAVNSQVVTAAPVPKASHRPAELHPAAAPVANPSASIPNAAMASPSQHQVWREGGSAAGTAKAVMGLPVGPPGSRGYFDFRPGPPPPLAPSPPSQAGHRSRDVQASSHDPCTRPAPDLLLSPRLTVTMLPS